jgi:hypothetical protein
MSATMINMESDFRMVDILNADQLEINDLIGIGEDIVKIISISSLQNGFSIEVENNFGEKDLVDISEDDKFELFIENF